MKTYLTEYVVINEVGRAHKVCGEVNAETKEEAMAAWEKNGHTFLGELVGEVDASDMAGLCDAGQEQRDRDWLQSVERVDEY